MKKVPYTLSESSLTIFWDGKPYTLRSDHPNFVLARQAIFDARYEDLGDLIDIKKSVENFIEGDIEVKDELIYYKGHRLHGVVVDKLLEMLRMGMRDSAPLVNFISRLQSNPSANSVNELYSFLSYKSLPTTPEGKVLGYKGVQSDYWSNTGNADTIVVQGETNARHQIYNGVGETIEIARRCVDDNRENHCSYGLHIGSYDYADSWAGSDGKLLIVEFDPEDAVSVPTDCDFAKLSLEKINIPRNVNSNGFNTFIKFFKQASITRGTKRIVELLNRSSEKTGYKAVAISKSRLKSMFKSGKPVVYTVVNKSCKQ